MFPLAALSAAAVPAAAHAPDCTLPDFDYNAACGPEFEVPAWGDGDGWTDPSKYTTIQLAELTGSGATSCSRNDDGEPAPRA